MGPFYTLSRGVDEALTPAISLQSARNQQGRRRPDLAEEFESIFSSIELPFFGREAARLDRKS
jgi:hypothetical protein